MKKQLVLNAVEFVAMGTLQLISIGLGVFAFGCIVFTVYMTILDLL